MAVIGLLGLLALAKIPVLLLPDLNARGAAAAVLDDSGKPSHHFAIEPRDPLGRARADVECDVRHAQHDASEAALVRRMNVDAIAPGTHGLDAIIAFAESEFGSFQRFSHLREAIEQRGAIR